MSNPKWLIPKTSGVSPQAITNAAGEKVYYNPAGGEPKQVAGEPIPAYVIDNIQRVQAEMMDVSGIHSVSVGKRAVGIVSGKGIEALQAGDASQLQLTQQSVETAVKKMAETILVLMKNYYNEPTFMRMLDQRGGAVFSEIKDTDIVDFPEVFIEANSLFRDELPDRDAKVVELLQLGLISPEEALKEISFKTGGMTSVLDKMAATNEAKKLIEAIAIGAEIEIYSTDDLDAFSKVFSDFIKSNDFQKLPPEKQDYISDVFNSISSYGKPPEALQQAKRNKVFPPEIPNEDAAATLLGGMNSQSGQLQLLQGVGERRQEQEIDPALQDLVRATEAPRADAEGISAYGRKGINPKVSGGIGG